MFILTHIQKMVSMTLAAALMVAFCATVQAAPRNDTLAATEQERAAKARMRNRALLLKKSHSRLAVVPVTPEQKRRESEKRRLERLENRQQLAMHKRWQPGQLSTDMIWEPLPGETVSPRLQASLKQVIQLLNQQIGKPYVWGGETPEQGFDCSGLVFYAFNPVLSRNLPRTANGMFQDRSLHHVRQEKLRRGDLVFFNINQRPGADHVGVYLGDGQFIEAPRTGLTIRISKLSDAFWQDHYLGARRILTEEAVL
ncbi:C40 family peptidase [Scandinavium sp. V105_16]|uniref:C40 family peptidase n=1 Tax=Scandinavium lactucae TaxID=3095028 RepID=A0AAJ2S8M9_9ENTR|nr:MULTISPECIES: C40 family peptidase [unclassified Scandinavium]MDX6020065.1 C40 family peptidase [Scandinavium sp. V105_16]MDX6032054.1 C40 family peptidase [Scandinavium sp. V105_12]MDX6040614.1 C40 family peptidase [Scandinavium sp. V105_6]MDX6051518.1 C40 family peptidase [Scandinavium sp. V105_1]